MANKKNIIEPIDASFDDVVGALVAKKPAETPDKVVPDYASLIHELTLPTGWSIPVADVVAQKQVRLDAEHYDPLVIENNKRLEAMGFKLVPLSDFAEVRLPGMFARIWAKEKAYGVPYINATDLMSYFSLGVPAQERFLSHASAVNIDELIINQKMILITCSGTIGRIFDVPKALDGAAGTHDIVRVLPRNKKERGFLRAYLTTDLAQIQILSHTHGGQIDHVTAKQVGSCLVPILPETAMNEISDLANKADALRAKGLGLLEKAAKNLNQVLLNG